jgi:excisionase family DNA binding protein
MTTATTRLLVDVRTAAAALGCGRSYVYDLINRGELPAVKLGRLTRVPVDGLTEFVSRLARYHDGVSEVVSLTPIHMDGMVPIIRRGGGVRRAQRESVQGRGDGTSG